MKIKKVNNVIDKRVLAVAPCFPPIALPIDDYGMIVDEDKAEKPHYVTVVYSKSTEEFMVFEFNQDIFEGLSYYEARNVNNITYEVILKRDKEGELRMTIGMKHKENFIPQEEKVEKLYNKLYDKYKSKEEYFVADL